MKKGTETPINGMSRKSLFRNLSYIVPNSRLHKITAYKNTVFLFLHSHYVGIVYTDRRRAVFG